MLTYQKIQFEPKAETHSFLDAGIIAFVTLLLFFTTGCQQVDDLQKAIDSFIPTVDLKPTVPPESLAYSNADALYVEEQAITPNTVTFTGGKPEAYEIEPALPDGLVMDSRTGAISGMPLVASAKTTYTIRAYNFLGSTTAQIQIVVSEPAPQISYSMQTYNIQIGVPLSGFAPTNTGGTPTSYSISPALTYGLSFNTATGVIAGTYAGPDFVSPLIYTVKAKNLAGESTASIGLSFYEYRQAPNYGALTFNFPLNKPITPISPGMTILPPNGFSVLPGLPKGLVLDPVTGVISGTPNQEYLPASYTIKAYFWTGVPNTTLTIKIIADQPKLQYPVPAQGYFRFLKNRNIDPVIPVNTGGPIDILSVSPALPTGLSIETATGKITGKPTTITEAKDYQITASNLTTSNTFTVRIEIAKPKVKQLASGSEHVCVQIEDGVKCWGRNTYGQMGDGTPASKSTPTDVAGLDKPALKIAVGYYHTCVLLNDGTVRCWGRNQAHQLGISSNSELMAVCGSAAGMDPCYYSPLEVKGAQGQKLDRFKDIVAGYDFSCGIYGDDNRVLCWGARAKWTGSEFEDSEIPTEVLQPDLGNSVMTSVISIQAGAQFACAQQSNGKLRCWGVNDLKQLGKRNGNGMGAYILETSEQNPFAQYSLGSQHGCMKTADKVKCWGSNRYYQMGTRGWLTSLCPQAGNTDCSDIAVDAESFKYNGEILYKVISGQFHSCAIVGYRDTDKIARCWGTNNYNEVGSTAMNWNCPLNPDGFCSVGFASPYFPDFTTLGVVEDMALGLHHSCALLANGEVYCWGLNTWGQLAYLSSMYSKSNYPLKVLGLE